MSHLFELISLRRYEIALGTCTHCAGRDLTDVIESETLSAIVRPHICPRESGYLSRLPDSRS
jgi:hypothetical protein